eukprot:518810-Pleurochrysis_carterae.AAC.1
MSLKVQVHGYRCVESGYEGSSLHSRTGCVAPSPSSLGARAGEHQGGGHFSTAARDCGIRQCDSVSTQRDAPAAAAAHTE